MCRSSTTGTPTDAGYAEELAELASRFGVELGEFRYTDDDYPAKVDVLLDLTPEVVSFTFGCASADDITRLRAAGITTVATVTTVAETEIAKARGVDAFVAQGPGQAVTAVRSIRWPSLPPTLSKSCSRRFSSEPMW